MGKKRPVQACTGPVSYVGQAALKKEIDVTIAAAGTNNVFLTSTAPASLEVYRPNRYYKNDEEYVFALAEAMRVEYEAIVAAGLILQVDDAWLPALWDRVGIGMGLEAFRARSAMRIEALNHALRNIPGRSCPLSPVLGQLARAPCLRSRARPHCRPHADGEGAGLSHRGRQCASRARSRGVGEGQAAAGKILIPGVVTHSTDVVEHPELVSQRLQRYARLVGAQNVIAGTDCGFGGRSHPQIAWAKLRSLVEGAALATKTLGLARA
jgi:5-methyltetrahydropteroyltriglutamate--homocysteine methyltransferase